MVLNLKNVFAFLFVVAFCVYFLRRVSKDPFIYESEEKLKKEFEKLKIRKGSLLFLKREGFPESFEGYVGHTKKWNLIWAALVNLFLILGLLYIFFKGGQAMWG